MTDGCGYANAEFFEAVRAQFKMPTRITAVQVRLHGAKVGQNPYAATVTNQHHLYTRACCYGTRSMTSS